MNFGTRLKGLRNERGLSQLDLSKALEIANSTLSLYESNKRFPDQETLKKIALFFDVSLDYLLAHSDHRSESNQSTRAFHTIDLYGLGEEDIQKIDEYVDFLKTKKAKKF